MDNRTCKICEEKTAKYLCPKCGIPYCSIKCYKDEQKHIKCSETFYKECVMEHMQNQEKEDPEKAKKMKEILQRVHNQDFEKEESDEEEVLDSDDDEPLDKRMEGVDLENPDEIWSKLTEEERQDFERVSKDFKEVERLAQEFEDVE